MIISENNTFDDIVNESILIDISLNSNSYNTMSKTDLVSPRENKKRRKCCSCCIVLTLTVASIITFTVLFLSDVLKKT